MTDVGSAAFDRRSLAGPFDIIGDVHGCADELEILLGELGYVVSWRGSGEGRSVSITAPHARKLIFVGDLTDRGPRSADVLRLVMSAVEDGVALSVQGNHDNKLMRWLRGSNVSTSHGLQGTIDELMAESGSFRENVEAFLSRMPPYLWLDGGKLVVVHAGLREAMIGRDKPSIRAFGLYGATTGEKDAFGLPVRLDWARDYTGKAAIVYGHTPKLAAVWVNNTICIDTGCAFGGKLTVLRWPERQLVDVPAARAYAELVRPLD